MNLRPPAFWLAIALLPFISTSCIPVDSSDNQTEVAPSTADFRAGLIAQEDLEFHYTSPNPAALTFNTFQDGDNSLLAWATADAVIHTNAHLLGLTILMRTIVNLPPSVVEDDYHLWSGTHEGLAIDVEVERTLTDDGPRYDFSMNARQSDAPASENLLLFEGYVIRTANYPAGQSHGTGFVSLDYDNLNTLQPERQIAGTSSAAFEHTSLSHRVDVRLLNVETPDRPDFPPRAAYQYQQTFGQGGELLWMSTVDWRRDGVPFEDVAARVTWNADLSGVGTAQITGGSLEVDYWNVSECWNPSLKRTFGELANPALTLDDGDLSNCSLSTPDELEVPTEDNLPGDEARI